MERFDSPDMRDAGMPGLVPAPQEIEYGTGSFAAPGEVNVVVPEGQGRSVILGILERAGVIVGKSGFPVDIRMKPADASEPQRPEFYELSLEADGARIRAPQIAGLFHGVRTLAGILHSGTSGRPGRRIREMRIRDWPDMAHRGIFVENKWGTDRMTREEWFLMIDRLSDLKMNRLGIGLYGCWGNSRFEPGPHGTGQPTEFLMVPVPGYPELKSRKHLRWFSPREERWHNESYLPGMFAEDFLGDVVAYAAERAVTVIPFVNSLGHNTLIPRNIPEISAKDEDGRPLGLGYCLSSPQTRRFIETFYGHLIDTYFPDGVEFFHIQMDEVWADNPDPADPFVREDPWCRCDVCRTHDREENLQEYIIWLVSMLVEKGVGKVVMWNDQLTRHMDALDGSFVERLKEAGLDKRLILHWWWYSNAALNDRTKVSIGRDLGLNGWVAPMACYYNWERYDPRMKNIELMLEMAHAEGGEGAVAYAVYDPAWSDHEMLEAGYAWNYRACGSWEEQEQRWASARFGDEAGKYLEAVTGLRAAAAVPAMMSCYHYTYTYVREGLPWPRSYPGEALEQLIAVPEAAAELVSAAGQARAAGDHFAALVRNADSSGDRAVFSSLRGEAARIEGLAGSFAVLLSVRDAAGENRLDQTHIAQSRQARELLMSSMALIEENKPAWIIPAILQSLSVLLRFFDQLNGDIEECLAGRRSPDALRWSVTEEPHNDENS